MSQAGGAADKDELARLQEVEDTHTKILGKYNRLRQMLAERNLNIAHTTRLIDDVPTRTELIQYERRFTELYDQVGPGLVIIIYIYICIVYIYMIIIIY